MTTWDFSSGANSPYIVNIDPVPNETGVSSSENITFDVIDINSDIQKDSIKIYIKEILAYDGYEDSFYPPWDGYYSEIEDTTVGLYDGYSITIDCTDDLSQIVSVHITCEDSLGNSLDKKWAFLVGTQINVLCYTDSYGLKIIDIPDITGECQTLSRTLLSENTTLSLKNNSISYTHGKFIDGYHFLSLSYDSYSSALGMTVVKNTVETKDYLDGYSVKQAQINKYGTLYLINENYNEIDVFYGADFRSDITREPDYIYDVYSTPSIIPGTISCLHIEDDASLIYSQGTRLYVGTSNGFSRIDTYDKQTSGNSDGYDIYGRSYSYGILESGNDYDVIGGNTSKVIAISSDETQGVILVATWDGYEEGGLTQISLEGNRKLIFLDDSLGLIPSLNIRNIFGKAY